MKKTLTLLTLSIALLGCGDDDTITDASVDGSTTDGTVIPDGDITPDGDVVPTPRGEGNPPTLGTQIDRQGRPAINTALNNTFNGDDVAKGAAKDAWNADSNPAGWAAAYSTEIAANLAILDSLDTVCGNQLLAGDDGDRYTALAGILADDQLYVNAASGTCGTYLGLEAEVVEVVAPGGGGCGGRTPNDDVIERSYSVLAAGILTGVDDGIAADVATHDPDTFPFLAAPN